MDLRQALTECKTLWTEIAETGEDKDVVAKRLGFYDYPFDCPCCKFAMEASDVTDEGSGYQCESCPLTWGNEMTRDRFMCDGESAAYYRWRRNRYGAFDPTSCERLGQDPDKAKAAALEIVALCDARLEEIDPPEEPPLTYEHNEDYTLCVEITEQPLIEGVPPRKLEVTHGEEARSRDVGEGDRPRQPDVDSPW